MCWTWTWRGTNKPKRGSVHIKVYEVWELQARPMRMRDLIRGGVGDVNLPPRMVWRDERHTYAIYCIAFIVRSHTPENQPVTVLLPTNLRLGLGKKRNFSQVRFSSIRYFSPKFSPKFRRALRRGGGRVFSPKRKIIGRGDPLENHI